MKIATKLFGAFAIVALICGIVGGVGWYGISTTEISLVEIAGVRLPSVRGTALMIGGMNEIRAIERTAVIASLTFKERLETLAQLKGAWHKFNKGLDLYESLPKTAAEAAIQKQFRPALQKWQVEHEKMVRLISEVQLDDVEGLETVLVSRRLDHIKWVGGLDVAIAESTEFSGQLDSKLCGLGKWLAQFKSDSNGFNALLDRFDLPHEKLHGLGNKINEIIFIHNFTSMGESVEARKVFDTEVEPTLAEIESIFEQTLEFVRQDIGRLNEALEIAFGSEKEAYEEAMRLLNETSELSADLAGNTGRTATAGARQSRLVAGSAVLLGIILALCFGYLISRSITIPLHKTIEIIKKIGLGDTSEIDVSAGKPVNCSNFKKCGNAECPSYGKKDACWVTSGSFATVKHCPRAQKGEDCRTCDIYGPKNALEELGSIVIGLANGLAEREKLALAIAGGNLNNEIELASDQDALGKALQKMQESLKTIIGQVQTTSLEIASGASQVADASQSLSQGATESAASIEEISASMTELGAQTSRNAENANQANQLAGQARTAADKGNQQMQGMVSAMTEINEAGQNISKIIKVIDEIAFQTNLLALNAAVEAARAGRHGKGFAVVAEEVRNLAARSAQAARETAELIEGSVAKTENGSAIANQTAEALAEIVSGITKVSDLVGEIAAASSEQAQGISQVSEGLHQIDQVTQQNTASAEESAAASEELSGQAEMMRRMLTRFTLEAGGRDPLTHAVAASTDFVLEASPRGPSARPSAHQDGWGASPSNSRKPFEVIALDGKEFGKY